MAAQNLVPKPAWVIAADNRSAAKLGAVTACELGGHFPAWRAELIRGLLAPRLIT
jgi:hypothetical protein